MYILRSLGSLIVPALASLSEEKVVIMCWVYRWVLSWGTDRNCWLQAIPGDALALQWNIREECAVERWEERELEGNIDGQK